MICPNVALLELLGILPVHKETQAAKEDSKGQVHWATPVKQQKPEAFDWSKFGATRVETPPRPAAERAAELQAESDRSTPSPIPPRWVN